MRDTTQLSAGANTILELNKFAFDTTTHAGVLDASVKRGSLAVISGKLAKANPDSVRFSTPTTTLGVRRRDETRQILRRRWETVQTSWGQVRIKIASMNGSVTNYAPEYEDCRQIAAECHVPLKQVMQEAARAYLESAPPQDKISKH